MPLARCMWYEDDGSMKGTGCHKLPSGKCSFVHPSEPAWDALPPSRQNVFTRNPRESSSQRQDGGWGQRKSSFNAKRNDSTSGGWGEAQNDKGARSYSKPTSGWNDTGGAWNSEPSSTWGTASSNQPPASNWGASTSRKNSTWGRSPSPVGQGTASSGGWGREPSPVGNGWTQGASSSGGWGFTTEFDAGGWGAQPNTEPGQSTSNGSWGITTEATAGGWGAQPTSEPATGGWGATSGIEAASGGWGTGATSKSAGGGWGGATNTNDNAGWDSNPAPSVITSSSDASKSTPTVRADAGWGDDAPSSSAWAAPNAKTRNEDWADTPQSQQHAAGSGTWQASSSNVAGWSGMISSVNGDKASAPLAGSATSVHDSTSIDVDEAATPGAEQAVSPPLPEGPTKTMKALLNAICAYRDCEEAKDKFARQKALYKGEQHAHVTPKGRDILRDHMKQVQGRYEASQKRRDGALRELESCGVFLGLEPPISPAKSSVAGDAVEPEQLSVMRGYADEIQQWIETARPQLEELRAQRRDSPSELPATNAVNAAPSSSQDVSGHVAPIQDEVDRLEEKLLQLEDYKEYLNDAVQDALGRVDDASRAEQQKANLANLTTQETAIEEMNRRLADLRERVDQLASRPRVASDLQVQRLRAEQEQLKLRQMELQQSNEELKQEQKDALRCMDNMRTTLDGLVAAASQPSFVLPDGGVDVESVVSAIEPVVLSQTREDVHQAIIQIKVGFDAAFARQHEQICSAVWNRLWPALQVIDSIRQHFDGVADGVPDGPSMQAQTANVLEAVGPLGQS